jgi:hypothetical protein
VAGAEITIENTSGGLGSGKLQSMLTGTIDDGNLDAEFRGRPLFPTAMPPSSAI